MKTYFCVTAVVKHKDKVLILKKASNDYNYPNRWSFCSGYAKEFEAAEDGVLREIKEETGLDAKIVKKGKIVEIPDKVKDKRWVVATYLCEADNADVKLCHENADFKWVSVDKLKDYDFVPGLSYSLDCLGLS
jgi:8-oxo-dGTP pyrophosphatase MutT (NUDIX family)